MRFKRREAMVALGVAACVGVYLSGAVPAWLPLTCVAWLVVTDRLTRRRRLVIPDTLGTLLQTALAGLFLWLAILRQPPMDPVGGLLALCAPLFVLRTHLRRSRINEFFLIVLSLLMATGAAAVSEGLRPLAITAFYLLAASLALPRLVERPSRTDRLGGTRVRATRVSARYAPSVLIVSTVLALLGLFGGSFLYLTVPRLSAKAGLPSEDDLDELDEGVLERRRGRLGAAGSAGGGLRTAFPREIRIGDIGEIKRDERIAFVTEVRLYGRPFDPAPSQANLLLLRARTFETYLPVTSTWVRDNGPFRRIPDDGRIEPGDAPLDFNTSLRNDEGRVLFMPQAARVIRGDLGNIYRSPHGTVITRTSVRQYSVEAAMPVTHPVDLRRLIPAHANERLLAVPASLSNDLDRHFPPTRGLTIHAAVDAIRAYFTREGFRYTLQLPDSLPADRDPVISFLDRKEGHCELFASAACLFLRRMGIPARLVGGVRCRERIGKGLYRARFANSHAWVEIACRDAGFVAFDFTPPDGSASGSGTNARGGRRGGDDEAAQAGGQSRSPVDWRNPFRYGRGEQERLLGLVGESVDFTPALYLFGALFVGILARAWWKERRDRPPSPFAVHVPPGVHRRTIAFYALWLRKCASQGHRRRLADTPREFLDLLPPELRAEGREVTAKFERIRYRPLP